MGRREDFTRILQHKQPKRLIIDLGGNPLSSIDGDSMYKVMEFIGLEPPERDRLLFGKMQRLDESLLEYFDIDTRSVGEILRPHNSQFEILGANEYIDEWGVRRKFTGMYWDIVEYPLRDADVDDLDGYRWPEFFCKTSGIPI